ncbi:MAG: LysR family transcriptional regulator [Rhizomicrobium sp.]|jgi:molybdate transport system regulatory protein
MARLTIRIDLGDEAALGPGKARLLELIDTEGSIRRAAAAMGMSYRRAWLLLQDIEAAMGSPVTKAVTGGAKGGGTSLTQTGRAIVNRYRAIEKIAARSAHVEMRALARLARPIKTTTKAQRARR